MARAAEFENVAVREDELPELDALLLSKDNPVPFDVRGGVENKIGKVNALMQVRCKFDRLISLVLIATTACACLEWNGSLCCRTDAPMLAYSF